VSTIGAEILLSVDGEGRADTGEFAFQFVQTFGGYAELGRPHAGFDVGAELCQVLRAEIGGDPLDRMRESANGRHVRTLDRVAEFVEALSVVAHEKLGQSRREVSSHAFALGQAIDPGEVDRAWLLRFALGGCLDRSDRRWRRIGRRDAASRSDDRSARGGGAEA